MAHGPPHRSTCFPHFISAPVETSLLQAGVTLLARRHCSTLASLFLSEWSDPSMYGTLFLRALNLIDNRHALADIMIPEDQPNRHESTVSHLCDTMVIDSFVRPLGLLINSSDAIASKDVSIATSFDRVLMSKSAIFDDAKTWSIYAKYEVTSDSRAIGDVFVLTRE